MRYNGFLSYSHAADGKLAPAVQAALHQLARPWYRLRSLWIFRDKTSLSASPSLWPSIEQALAESEYFLLMASPDAARSPWVQREIGWWLQNRSTSNILILLTDGEVQWQPGESDFDWAATNALPDLLRGRFDNEPLWVDLRWAHNQDKLSLRHLQFRSAILDVGAPLLKRSKDLIDGDDVRVYRRNRQAASAAVALSLMLAILAVYGQLSAVVERNLARSEAARATANGALATKNEKLANQKADEARRNLDEAVKQRKRAEGALNTAEQRRIEAEEQRNLAQVGEQAAVSLNLAESNPLEGLDAANQAVLNSSSKLHKVTPQAQFSLASALNRARETSRFTLFGGGTAFAISADSQLIAAAGPDYLRLFGPQGRSLAPPLSAPGNAHLRLTTVDISPDGALIATGGGTLDHPMILSSPCHECAVRIWDRRGSLVAGPLKGHTGPVYAVRFSPDGKTIASAGPDKTIRFWNRKGEPIGNPVQAGLMVASLVFAADSRSIFAGGSSLQLSDADIGSPEPDDYSIVHFDLNGKSLDAPKRGHTASVRVLAVSHDGDSLVSAGEDHTIRVWPLKDAGIFNDGAVIRGHTGVVTSLAVNAEGIIVSGSADHTVRFWDLRGRPLSPPLLGHTDGVSGVLLAPDGHPITVDRFGTALGWDLRYLETRAPVSLPGRVAAFDAGSNTLAVANHSEVALYQPNGKPAGKPFRGHQRDIVALAISPDGNLIASADADLLKTTANTILLSDREGNPVGKPINGNWNGVNTLAFSPDGAILAVATGAPSTSDDDFETAESRNRLVLLFNAKGDSVAPPMHHNTTPRALAFHPFLKLLAVGYSSGTVRFWDYSGKNVGQPFWASTRRNNVAVTALTFRPDGFFLAGALTTDQLGASGGENEIQLWTLKSQAVGPPMRSHQELIRTLAFSPDGRVLASAGGVGLFSTRKDYGVRLWDLEGNLLCPVVEAHAEPVKMVAFSQDGHRLLSYSEDGHLVETSAHWLEWVLTAEKRLALHRARTNAQAGLERARQALEQNQDDETVRVASAYLASPLGDANLESRLYNVRAVAFAHLRRTDPALADFAQALLREPFDQPTLQNRARSNFDLGRYAAAIADYTESLRLFPLTLAYTDEDPYSGNPFGGGPTPTQRLLALERQGEASIRCDRAEAYAAAGQWKPALDDLNQVIGEYPGWERALRIRAGVYSEQGHFKAALDDLNQALGRNRKSADLLVDRAEIYRLIGRVADGKADYEQAIQIVPKSYQLRESYGSWLFRADQPREAASQWLQALNMHEEPDATLLARNVLGVTMTQGMPAGQRAYRLFLKAFPEYADKARWGNLNLDPKEQELLKRIAGAK